MNLDRDGAIIRITQKSLKENTVCKDTCISTLRQALRNTLMEKITGFIHLKPKHRWDLMFKMVFRQHLFNFLHWSCLWTDCTWTMIFDHYFEVFIVSIVVLLVLLLFLVFLLFLLLHFFLFFVAMYVCIYLSIYLSTYLSIHPSIHPSIYL